MMCQENVHVNLKFASLYNSLQFKVEAVVSALVAGDLHRHHPHRYFILAAVIGGFNLRSFYNCLLRSDLDKAWSGGCEHQQ